MIRSFVAVDLSAEVLANLARLRGELSSSGASVRWQRETGLHCTLKFLGEVQKERLEEVHQALRQELTAASALDVRARGLGVFPNPQKPRVVWVGLESASGSIASLKKLVSRVETAIEPLGFAPEKRAFHPHVSLGRVRAMSGWNRLAERMRSHENEDFGATQISRVVVYRSDLGPGGSAYTPLWTIPLAESSLGFEPEEEDSGN